MNQDKLEVVIQEMARVNINILGISELKWTGMGEFISDGNYIYYCGQKALRRNRVILKSTKESEVQFLILHPSTAFQTLLLAEGCSISSKGFLPTVVDIMVI